MAVKCILTGQAPSVLDGVTENVQTQIDNKVDKVTGKGLSTEDYTTVEKTKLSGIEEGAQKNTVTSVAGKTGAVTLAASDVGAIATVKNLTVGDSLYYRSNDVIDAGFQKIDNDTHMVLVGYHNGEDRSVGLFVRPNSDYPQISVGVYNEVDGDMDIVTPGVTFTNLGTPHENTDAVNKAYVDTSISAKQSAITAKGILKGDGAGNVTAAEEAEVELVDLTIANVAGLQSALDANKGTAIAVTLASASWTGTAAPYTYTISNDAITATSNQELTPATDITADQLAALQGANIIDGGQAAGSMTLKAFGEKPSIDIPVRVIVKG